MGIAGFMTEISTNWDNLCYPRLCGLLGSNPSRLSQAMHNAGFDSLKLPFAYHAFKTQDTKAGFDALRSLGFRGLSLTIPHKEKAMGLVDVIAADALKIGAINTAINYGGEVRGYNTDYVGILRTLSEANYDSTGKVAVVVGAGGAARAAVFALKRLQFKKIYIANRTQHKAVELACEFAVEALATEAISDLLSTPLLLVNATPVGLEPKLGSLPFDFNRLGPAHTVFDMVTKQTELLQTATQQGSAVIAGVRMLLFQAVCQFELFTEQEAPVTVMEEALCKECVASGR